MRPRWLVNSAIATILLVSSTLISLVGAEVGLRLLGHEPNRMKINPFFVSRSWAMPDPELGWVNRAGSYPSMEHGNAMMNFTPDGRRFDPAAKEQDLATVVVVGCSMAQGYGVGDSETFSHLLNAMTPELQVINYGTAGYGTYQSLLRLQSYFKAHGGDHRRLIVYGLYGGHLERNVANANWIFTVTTSEGRRLVPPHARIEQDQLVAPAWGPVALWPLETRSALSTSLHNNFLRIAHYVSNQVQQEVLKAIVLRMAGTARKNDAKFMVAGLADLPVWFGEWARLNDIDLADCQHPHWGIDRTLQVGGTGHPGTLMHAWWAQCLRDRISAER